VSFLNSKPLVDGLRDSDDTTVRFDVPSRLLDDLLAAQVEVALCPVIDFQYSPKPLVIVPVGGIGCDGPTLTVRLFSRRPIDTLTAIHADTDSHTSVALLQVVLAGLYNLRPRIHPLDRAIITEPHRRWPNALLLIGDKVVTRHPPEDDYPHQLDLGEAWKRMTGLPFVFATWMARPHTDLGDVPTQLVRQRLANAERIDELVDIYAEPLGWPRMLARRYLGQMLRYGIGSPQLQAIQQFWQRCAALGIIEEVRPMQLYAGSDVNVS
jgi:chorismate dehydratase